MLNSARGKISLIALGCSLLLAAHAAEPTKRFDLPAGDLLAAIEALEKQAEADVEMVYQPEKLKGLRTSGARGNLTTQDAVRKLLEGTQLRLSTDESTGAMLIVSAAQSGGPVAGRRSSKAQAAAETNGMQLARSESTDADGTAEGAEASTAAGQESSQAAQNVKVGEVQEIIVTAQKRKERLIEVPISIGVLSGEKLDRGSSQSIADALNRISGVSIVEYTPGEALIAVRGVLSDLNAATSATGYYVDEVPFAFINGGRLPDMGAFDTSRVEVLRGPQGTLYGANALNGVVRIIYNDPDYDDFKVKGRVRGSLTEGHDDNFAGDLMLNAPLLEGKLAIRAVASYSDEGPYITSRKDGGSRNDTEARNYRVKLGYQPTPELDIRLGYLRNVLDKGGRNEANDDYTTLLASAQPGRDVMDMYSATITYDAPSISVLSSTSYLDYSMNWRQDLGPFSASFRFPMRSFQHETRLNSNGDGPWRWSAGAYYRNGEEGSTQDASPVIVGVLRFTAHSESYAVFSEVGRSFADDKFELTGGLRYFHDKISQRQTGSFSDNPSAVPPSFGPYFNAASPFDKLTWRLVATYKLNPDVNVYASASTGFRSGRQQSVSALASDPTLSGVDPDTVLNFEVGAKGRLGGGFSYELAAYHMRWDGTQQTVVIPTAAVPSGVSLFVNGGRAEGVGVDAALNFEPLRGLNFFANVSWSGLEFVETTLSRNVPLFVESNRVNNSPEWTGALGVDYATPVWGEDLNFVFGADYAFGSERQARSLINGVATPTYSDWMESSNVHLGLDSKRWSLTAFVDNVLDYDGAVTPRNAFTTVAVRMRPRTYGLQANFNF